MKRLRKIVLVCAGVLVIGLVGLAVWLSYGPRHQDHLPFYAETPLAADTEPGTLLRIEPLSHPRPGMTAYRILYTSLGMDEEPVAVSGLVVVPEDAATSEETLSEGRPIISWAHYTTGIDDPCAPSRSPADVHGIDGIEAALDSGYVVVASDYIGLGTPGPHPYMVGPVTGRGILDAIRATRSISEIGASNRAFLWGHSQGGHGVLFAAEIAPTYAPELDIRGVAAASAPTDLTQVVHNNVGTFFGNVLVAYAAKAWSEVYGLSLQQALVPAAIPIVGNISEQCIQHKKDDFYVLFDAVGLQGGMFNEGVLTSQTWLSLLDRNSVGKMPIVYPVYLAQGSADEVVSPDLTIAFARKLCADGANLTFELVAGAGHNETVARSKGNVIAWMDALLAEAKPQAGCVGLPALDGAASADRAGG